MARMNSICGSALKAALLNAAIWWSISFFVVVFAASGFKLRDIHHLDAITIQSFACWMIVGALGNISFRHLSVLWIVPQLLASALLFLSSIRNWPHITVVALGIALATPITLGPLVQRHTNMPDQTAVPNKPIS